MVLGLGIAAALVIAAAFGAALWRGRAADAAGASAADYDLRVYRDQLAEVERDIARGVTGAEEGERLKAEVARRLIEADRKSQADAQTAAGGPPRWAGATAAGLIGAAFLGAVWLYDRLGVPDYPDLPIAERIAAADRARAERPGQAAAEAEAAPALAAGRPEPDADFVQLMDKLRAVVAERPGDVRGLELLSSNEARLGNYAAASEAQTRLVVAKGEAATADDYAGLAEMMIFAAGGYVSPEAEAALGKALALDQGNGVARYYSGLMLAQTGRPDLAFRIWRPLADESPPDAPWMETLRGQIGEIAALAGVDYTPPEAPGTLPGPDAAAVAAAGEMNAEDRDTMIRGMVARLSDRLANEGGTPEEWARLIGAYGVLGETDQARAIWTEAQTRFAAHPEALATVRAAAEQAGVAE